MRLKTKYVFRKLNRIGWKEVTNTRTEMQKTVKGGVEKGNLTSISKILTKI